MDFLSGIEGAINNGLSQIPVVGGTLSSIVGAGEQIVNAPMNMANGLMGGLLGGGRPQPQGNAQQGGGQQGGFFSGGGGGGGSNGGGILSDPTTILLVGGGAVVLLLLLKR